MSKESNNEATTSALETIRERIKQFKQWFNEKFPDGRKNPTLNNILFGGLLVILTIIMFIQPSAGAESQRAFIYNIILQFTIFAILAIGLNLHTGYSGLVNFGVIFFAGIGALGTGILISRYNMNPFLALITSILIAMVIGYYLSYPTIRLRADYFAIVTITLGEILRVAMLVDPFLKTTTEATGAFIGITNIKGPFQTQWEQGKLPLSKTEPYQLLLMIFGIIALVLVYVFAQWLIDSPYGRALKGIREDEDVVESYGIDVFKTKAWILAIGSGIMALAGGIWAWFLHFIGPSFFVPASSTFLVWAAFIIGGKGNNKGMMIGAYFIVLIDQVFRNLSNLTPAEREKNIVLHPLDVLFKKIVVDLEDKLFGPYSYEETIGKADTIQLDLNALRLILIGFVIILFMIKYEEGLLPEIPYRPTKILGDKIKTQAMKSKEFYLSGKNTEVSTTSDSPGEELNNQGGT